MTNGSKFIAIIQNDHINFSDKQKIVKYLRGNGE